MSKFPAITHVIYDLDGLLLDTESIHARVNQTMAEKYGREFDPAVLIKVRGRNAQTSAQVLVDFLELPISAQEFLRQKNLIIRTQYADAEPMPGAIRLTQHLHQHCLPQGIASSSAQAPFRLKTSRHQDWFKLFDCVVLGDDPAVHNGKPAPDIFLVAAQRLGAQPENCLVFEDSSAGISAAKQAGMSVVAVPDPEMELLLSQAADQILTSLTEFRPEQWHLPKF